MIARDSGIAFFDLDGTITQKDTFITFIRYVKGDLGWILGLCFLSPYIIAYYMGCYSNHRLKSKFFSCFFKSMSVLELQKFGNDFAMNVLPQLNREGALRLLAKHKQLGHDIYIVTASADIWTAAWCEQEKYQLIATSFAHHNGQYTGAIDGFNCYGAEKFRRIQPIIAEQQPATIYAYGDQTADQYFLSLADHAYCMPLSMENVLKHKLLVF